MQSAWTARSRSALSRRVCRAEAERREREPWHEPLSPTKFDDAALDATYAADAKLLASLTSQGNRLQKAREEQEANAQQALINEANAAAAERSALKAAAAAGAQITLPPVPADCTSEADSLRATAGDMVWQGVVGVLGSASKTDGKYQAERGEAVEGNLKMIFCAAKWFQTSARVAYQEIARLDPASVPKLTQHELGKPEKAGDADDGTGLDESKLLNMGANLVPQLIAEFVPKSDLGKNLGVALKQAKVVWDTSGKVVDVTEALKNQNPLIFASSVLDAADSLGVDKALGPINYAVKGFMSVAKVCAGENLANIREIIARKVDGMQNGDKLVGHMTAMAARRIEDGDTENALSRARALLTMAVSFYLDVTELPHLLHLAKEGGNMLDSAASHGGGVRFKGRASDEAITQAITMGQEAFAMAGAAGWRGVPAAGEGEGGGSIDPSCHHDRFCTLFYSSWPGSSWPHSSLAGPSSLPRRARRARRGAHFSPVKQ